MDNLGETLRDLVEGLLFRGDRGRNSPQLPMHASSRTTDSELLEAFKEQCADLQNQLDEVRTSFQKAQAARQDASIRAAEYARQLEVAKAALRENPQENTTDAIRKELLLQLFPLLNDLDLSFGAVPPELKRIVLFTSWYRGIRLISKRLHKTLEEEWKLTPLASEGADFDPQIHEAIAVDKQANQPWGTIARVERQGYALGSTVLQVAKVIVSDNASIQRQPRQA